MRHLKYEWEKFFSFRYFWFLCAVFLLFNLWNFSEQIRMEFPASSVRQLYTDFQEQPEGSERTMAGRAESRRKMPTIQATSIWKKNYLKSFRENGSRQKNMTNIWRRSKERSAKMSGSIFSDEGTFAWRNAK